MSSLTFSSCFSLHSSNWRSTRASWASFPQVFFPSSCFPSFYFDFPQTTRSPVPLVKFCSSTAGSCCEGDVNSLYSGLWLKECLLVTIMNIRKIMKYLYKGGLTRGWGRRAPGVVSSHHWVGTLEGEQWANISEHSGHQTLACLILPNSKNNAASRFGIRVQGEISKVVHIHWIPRMFLTGEWSDMCLNMIWTYNLILLCVILDRGRHKSWKCYYTCSLFTYIY